MLGVRMPTQLCGRDTIQVITDTILVLKIGDHPLGPHVPHVPRTRVHPGQVQSACRGEGPG